MGRIVLFVLGCIFALSSSATITQDENIVRVVLYCGGVFYNSQAIVYDRDKQNLERIHRGVMDELFAKYGKSDSNLMISKAAVQGAQAKGDPAETCRSTLDALAELKRKFGAYLSQD